MPSYEVFGRFYDAVMGDRGRSAKHLYKLIRDVNSTVAVRMFLRFFRFGVLALEICESHVQRLVAEGMRMIFSSATTEITFKIVEVFRTKMPLGPLPTKIRIATGDHVSNGASIKFILD